MTRIFDALRKAQPPRPVAPEATPVPLAPPPPSALPRPARPVGRLDPGLKPKPLVLPPGTMATLPEDVIREMTTLRVSLEATLTERVPRVVMFASSQGGEGTSTVTLQFVLALAQDTRIRTLLVDAHARRPAHAEAFHAPEGAPAEGTAVAHLDVLPLAELYRTAGVIPPADARQAIETLGGAYDWVVIDGPPALEASDSAALAAVADGLVVVVQAHRTKRPVLARAVDLARRSGARVLGTVLNRRRLEIPDFIYRRI